MMDVLILESKEIEILTVLYKFHYFTEPNTNTNMTWSACKDNWKDAKTE